MLKVAVSTTGATAGSVIPSRFLDATHLLIIDAETDDFLGMFDGTGLTPAERSLYFAYKAAEFDCEALLCGELEPEAFSVLAEENCITRYMAAPHSASEGIRLMNAYALPLITDYIGGDGCPDIHPDNCDHHHDHCDEDCAGCEISTGAGRGQ